MYIFYILHLALYVSSEFAGTVKPITVGKYNYKIIMLITLQGVSSNDDNYKCNQIYIFKDLKCNSIEAHLLKYFIKHYILH